MNETFGSKSTIATIGGSKETLVFGARYDVRYGEDAILRDAILHERAANGDLIFLAAPDGSGANGGRRRVRPSTIDAIVLRTSPRGEKEGAAAYIARLEAELGVGYGSWISTDAGQSALAAAAAEDRDARRSAGRKTVAAGIGGILAGTTTAGAVLSSLVDEGVLPDPREVALAKGVALAESLASEPEFRDRDDVHDAIAAEVVRQIPELKTPERAAFPASPKADALLEEAATAKREKNRLWRCPTCKRRTRQAECSNGHPTVSAPAGKRKDDR